MHVYIRGHRRSGNNFLKALLNLNFVIDSIGYGHKIFDTGKTVLDKQGPKIFIVRDGRDLITACYYWWKGAPGSRNDFKNKTFEQFIRGKIIVKGQPNIPPEMFNDPIGYWADYVIGWHNKLYAVRYEDLKNHPIAMLKKLEKEFSFERKINRLKPLKELVGRRPRKGIVGDWKNHFSIEDEVYFWEKAEQSMRLFGYRR